MKTIPFRYNDAGLTRYVKASGCAAKLDPSDLKQYVGALLEPNSNLISSLNSNEDAGVFALGDGRNLVQTVDFITPVVGDPYIYGAIAAANSLSDVFAMGGRALTAMNVVGFDKCHFGEEVLAEILAGAKEKIKECGATLVGGHSIETPEMIFGLSVTGIVGDDFWSNNTAQIGDMLILTKPLGTGVMATAIKGEMAGPDEIRAACESMSMLNFYAQNALLPFGVHAATDVTGFGFLGHLSEMLRNDISADIYEASVPVMRAARKYAALGVIPAGTYKNAEFTRNLCSKEADLLLSDAQTSGGLLAAVAQKDAYKALKAVKEAGCEEAEIVGEIKPRGEFAINLI